MKKKAEKKQVPEMRAEYDFSRAVRGKHYAEYARGTNVVLLDPDVQEVFPDAAAVNQALRSLAKIIRECART